MPVPTTQEQFGQIDIYLFDQLLKGRISPGMRILDAGCGSGRNLVYFLREGYEVYAVDPDVQAVESVRALARMFASALPESNFLVEAVERMSFEDAPVPLLHSLGHSRPLFRSQISQSNPSKGCPSTMRARTWLSATPSSILRATMRTSSPCCTERGGS